jgi:multiple sugar transport system ATP-binding protein
MNFIPSQVVQVDNGQGVVLNVEGGGNYTLHASPGNGALSQWVDREVLLGVRPEYISDSLPDLDEDSHVHELECKVTVVEPTGADTIVFININSVEVTCRVHPDSAGRPGEIMKFVTDMSKVFFFDPETGERI